MRFLNIFTQVFIKIFKPREFPIKQSQKLEPLRKEVNLKFCLGLRQIQGYVCL